MREREGETEREKQRGRKREGETEREKNKETERQKERGREREKEIEREGKNASMSKRKMIRNCFNKMTFEDAKILRLKRAGRPVACIINIQ